MPHTPNVDHVVSPSREGDSKGWDTVLVTALDSWGKSVPLKKETLKGGIRCQ
jgi:hypothetical protein